LTSDDSRTFWHPFYEVTNDADLLRRIRKSNITDWSDFLDGCLNGPRNYLGQAPLDISNIDPDQQDIPDAVLVCDLHYENDWGMRRRFSKKCSDLNRNMKPCDGTYACLCKHSEKEYYRVSKAMPVVPLDYTGLNTTLYDTYLMRIVEESSGDEIQEEGILKIAIIIGSTVVGTIIMCCIGYHICLFCANRQHKITYVVKEHKTPAQSKMKSKK